MRNPTRNGVDEEWRKNIGESNRGKTRSIESRKRYRESKLGEKNPNFKHGLRTGMPSRIGEVNHRVVSVTTLSELADVFCLTVPETGWFYANNVLVKNCSFCCINAPFQSHRYRMRKPDDVVAEILMLHEKYGVKTIKITDEMFVLNERHYTAICEGLVDIGDDLNIWAYARVDTVKPRTLSLMRNAGIRWLALGIESESKYVRDGVDKRLKHEDIARVVKGIQAAGINVIANYIFGLPDDDLESMRATLAMALDLNTEFANFYSAMAYPGSPLYDEAIKNGWNLPNSWNGYAQHGYETRPLDTRHVDGATVLKFRDDAFQIYFSSPKYLDMVGKKFGAAAPGHIREMVKRELPRRLLQETYAPRERVSAQ